MGKDLASSDEAEHANTEHPETDLKDEIDGGEPKQMPVQMPLDTEQSHDLEENPPKRKKKRQNKRKRRHPQPTESEPNSTKQTKFENMPTNTNPLADINNNVTDKGAAFPPECVSTADAVSNEIDLPHSCVTFQQPFFTMFSDAPNELNNGSAAVFPNEIPKKKKKQRRKKCANTQLAESESKVGLEPEVVAASDGGILSGYSEQPPQESLRGNLSKNEPTFSQPVGPNITMFYNCDSINDNPPLENHPQAKKKRPRRKKKPGTSQSAQLEPVSEQMHSETVTLPISNSALNDSELPPTATNLVENFIETELPTSVPHPEPSSVASNIEMLPSKGSNLITPILPAISPQIKKKRQNKRKVKHPSSSELEPFVMEETTLGNALPPLKSTKSFHIKRKPRRKGKGRLPANYTSLPSVASNTWQNVFPSYVSFSDNKSHQLRSKDGFVPDQLVYDSTDVVDAVL